MKTAIKFLQWVTKHCQYIQSNIVEYQGVCYVTYGKPFDEVRSTEDLFNQYLETI